MISEGLAKIRAAMAEAGRPATRGSVERIASRRGPLLDRGCAS
jgi:hypothetical protein